MKARTITATELARNLSEILDRLEKRREDVVIVRRHRAVARLVPEPAQGSALEVLSDLYRTISDEDAQTWEADSRRGGWADEWAGSLRDPWAR